MLFSPDIPFGFGTIYYNDFVCTGQEARLLDCGHSLSEDYCTSSHQPGVRCQPGKRLCWSICLTIISAVLFMYKHAERVMLGL